MAPPLQQYIHPGRLLVRAVALHQDERCRRQPRQRADRLVADVVVERARAAYACGEEGARRTPTQCAGRSARARRTRLGRRSRQGRVQPVALPPVERIAQLLVVVEPVQAVVWLHPRCDAPAAAPRRPPRPPPRPPLRAGGPKSNRGQRKLASVATTAVRVCMAPAARPPPVGGRPRRGAPPSRRRGRRRRSTNSPPARCADRSRAVARTRLARAVAAGGALGCVAGAIAGSQRGAERGARG